MQDKKLKNRQALITGGSNGIGRAITLALAREGSDVVFTYYKNKDMADDLVKIINGLGQNAHAIFCDFSDDFNIDSLLKESEIYLPKIDILVNNVGILTRTQFIDITFEEYDLVLKANLRIPFFLTQRLSRKMISENRKGSIINVSSLSGELSRSKVTHYQCSKAALNMLTQSVAYELAPYGIRVNTIVPGLTKTNANRDQWEQQTKTWSERIKNIPLGRVGSPEDHAGAAVFLASHESAWITGQKFIIDGGISIV